jgi:hypothetical protein
MIEITRSDWSPKQKITFVGYANQLGAKIAISEDPAKYDKWCAKAREAGRELRINGRAEEIL